MIPTNKPAKPDFSIAAAQQQAGDDPGSLQSQIDALSALLQMLIATHTHSGAQSRRIQLETDIGGLFATVSAVPTNKPQTIYDQVQIYVSSGTFRLYWYDAVGQTWHYSVGV